MLKLNQNYDQSSVEGSETMRNYDNNKLSPSCVPLES